MIAGLILAGGQSRRFGGDKSGADLAGRKLCDWVAERAAPQVDGLFLNAPEAIGAGACGALAPIPDDSPGHFGPLAGILAGLRRLATHPSGFRWMATFPVDSPFFPPDMVARLFAAAAPVGRLAVAQSEGRLHPVFALWPLGIVSALDSYLNAEGGRKMMTFLDQVDAVTVSFDADPFDPFFNINTPDDLLKAKGIAERYFSS